MTALRKDQDDFVCKKNCFVCIRLFYNVIDDSKIQHLSDFIEQHVKLSSPFLLEKVISIYKNILNIETLKMRIDHIIKLYSTYRICYYYPDYAKSFSTNLFGLTILAKNIIKKNLNVYLCRSNPKAIFIANPDAIDAVRFSIKVEDYKDMNSVCFCLDKHDMSLSDPLIVVGGATNLIKSLKPMDIFNAPTIKVGPAGPSGPSAPGSPATPPRSRAVVPLGQLSLFGNVTALVLLLAQRRYPPSGVLSETYLLYATEVPLKSVAPIMIPKTILPIPESAVMVIGLL